jgi:MoaA/NifB/PqqE/SkfB family radical SAM enzyme
MTAPLHLEELILEITNACHHRCVHCSTRGGPPIQNELSQDERLSVLRQAAQLGLVELRLLGGDPLYRMLDTCEILTEASDLGVKRALLYTSAVEPRLEWLEKLNALSTIHISAEASIYSPNATIHDAITLKPGSLDLLLSNSHEAVRVGFDLNWNFVWMKPNFLELEGVVALARAIGIKRVRILRLMLNGRARDHHAELSLRPEWEEQCNSIIESLAVRFPEVWIATSKPLDYQLKKNNNDVTPACSAGESQLVVQADGEVLPCIGLKDMPQFRIGNIRSEPLEQLFLRSRQGNFVRTSQEFSECPAILFQKRPELIQLTIGRS